MFKLHTNFFTLLLSRILHFCLGNPNHNLASMPSGLLAWLTTLRKKEYGSLFFKIALYIVLSSSFLCPSIQENLQNAIHHSQLVGNACITEINKT